MEWVTDIGPYKVEHIPVGSGGGLVTTPSFCVHTTEGPTYLGAITTIKGTGYAPHFTVGDGRIAQMRSLSEAGSALRDHNDAFIQVECVGFSKLEVYELPKGAWEPLVALTRFLHVALGIPLYRPKGWPDLLEGFPASNNRRRQERRALTERGVYGHVDVPDQSPTWHYDPGSLNYTALFAAVQEGDDDMRFDQFEKGVKSARAGEHQPGASADPDFAFGYRFYTDAVSQPKTAVQSPHVHDVTPKGKNVLVTTGPAKA